VLVAVGACWHVVLRRGVGEGLLGGLIWRGFEMWVCVLCCEALRGCVIVGGGGVWVWCAWTCVMGVCAWTWFVVVGFVVCLADGWCGWRGLWRGALVCGRLVWVALWRVDSGFGVVWCVVVIVVVGLVRWRFGFGSRVGR